jgi:hypothetical protein
MELRMRQIILVFFLGLTNVAQCQVSLEVGSAEAIRYLADLENARTAEVAAWNGAKKITLMKILPKRQSKTSGASVDKVSAGWVGEIPYVLRVVSVVDEDEMLLSTKTGTFLWIVGYKTADFVDGVSVAIVGPVRAGDTKTYQTVAGGSKTVRTFSIVDGEELIEFEKGMDARQLQAEDDESRRQILSFIKLMIWGKKKPTRVPDMDRRMLGQYRNMIERIERQIKAGKVNIDTKLPIALLKGNRIEFSSDRSKELALEEIKKLLAELP